MGVGGDDSWSPTGAKHTYAEASLGLVASQVASAASCWQVPSIKSFPRAQDDISGHIPFPMRCFAVHKEYLVPPAQYDFSLLLQPLQATSGQGGGSVAAATAAWRALL